MRQWAPGDEALNDNELVIGSFYWVIPVLDPDGQADWERDLQPARYAGRNTEGEQLWNCINIDGLTNWPMQWIGGRIDAPQRAG